MKIPGSPSQLLSGARSFLFSPNFQLYRNMAFYSLASLLGNFFAFLFHFYIARLLSVSDYGSANVLFALAGVLALPFGSFSALIIKRVAQEKEKAGAIAIEALKVAAFSWLLSTLLLLLFSPQFSSLFHIADDGIPLLLAIILGLAFISIPLNGVLQGLQRFYLSGAAFAAGSLAKLASAFLLVAYAGLGLSGALASYGATSLAIALLSLAGLASIFRKPGKFSLPSLKGAFLHILLIDIGLVLLFSGDLVVLGSLFSGDALGFYAAGSIIAKTISYALLPLAAVAFPKMVEQASSKIKPKALLSTLALVFVGGTCALILYSLFGSFFLALLYSEKYLQGAQYILMLSASTVFYCLNMVLSRYFIADKSNLFSYLCLLFPVAGLATLYFANSIALAPTIMAGANAALFISASLLYISRTRHN